MRAHTRPARRSSRDKYRIRWVDSGDGGAPWFLWRNEQDDPDQIQPLDMVPVSRLELARYALHGRIGRQQRNNALVRLSLVVVAATAAGCFALAVFPQRTYHNEAPGSSHLIDILPSDLDVLKNDRVIGALGVQLLLFGGWKKSGVGWTRDTPPRTLQDRLERITPTWKAGGPLDYTHDAQSGIFGDALPTGMTIAQLADTLDTIGLTAADFDAPARTALNAMLSWRLPDIGDFLETSELVLLIFSFDATPFCHNVTDCPLPGPSNELLAATAARFVNERANNYQQNVRIIAQWEVAAALLQSHGLPVTAVGTPGAYENTAEIFEHMLCELNDVQQTILLAHPDHLRRVLWTTQTILRHRTNLRSKCALPQGKTPRLLAALQPYDLEWPLRQTERGMNMFASESTLVHTNGQEIMTSWYDDNLGFFPDGDPQKWTHQREVWLLYDHWAVAKGIVTGTIDAELSLLE